MFNRRNYIVSITLFVALVLASTDHLGRAEMGNTIDHGLYGQLLKRYVGSNGEVDYGGFKAEEAKLDGYLKILEEVDTRTLDRNEQLAFYINAYNAWTIKLILGAYPGVESIKELGVS
ncbi:MAG: DUF547 domain-containing protein [Deltaproteobacteria bacterium]|nr:DUF547 domain-containing protein [Deltaproteobacteria bacterium]